MLRDGVQPDPKKQSALTEMPTTNKRNYNPLRYDEIPEKNLTINCRGMLAIKNISHQNENAHGQQIPKSLQQIQKT